MNLPGFEPTLDMVKAVHYECGPWRAEVREDSQYISVHGVGRFFSQGHEQPLALPLKDAEALLVVLSAAAGWVQANVQAGPVVEF